MAPPQPLLDIEVARWPKSRRTTQTGVSLESAKTEIKVRIVNRQGLHARPAAQFVRSAGQFPECEVTVVKDGNAVNGKSIMGMLMLEAAQGTELTITTEGEGSEELSSVLRDLVESGFDEDKQA